MNRRDSRHRRSIRLRDYDYAQQGAYFVTICTQLRECFFDIPTIREITEQCWSDISQHFPTVELDEWVVMPNHLHGVLLLFETAHVPTNRDGDNHFSTISPFARTLAVVIRTYKAAVSRQCNHIGNLEFAWQRNYYEHVIRSENELNRVRQYILDNPINWEQDAENPIRLVDPS